MHARLEKTPIEDKITKNDFKSEDGIGHVRCKRMALLNYVGNAQKMRDRPKRTWVKAVRKDMMALVLMEEMTLDKDERTTEIHVVHPFYPNSWNIRICCFTNSTKP